MDPNDAVLPPTSSLCAAWSEPGWRGRGKGKFREDLECRKSGHGKLPKEVTGKLNPKGSVSKSLIQLNTCSARRTEAQSLNLRTHPLIQINIYSLPPCAGPHTRAAESPGRPSSRWPALVPSALCNHPNENSPAFDQPQTRRGHLRLLILPQSASRYSDSPRPR